MRLGVSELAVVVLTSQGAKARRIVTELALAAPPFRIDKCSQLSTMHCRDSTNHTNGKWHYGPRLWISAQRGRLIALSIFRGLGHHSTRTLRFIASDPICN